MSAAAKRIKSRQLSPADDVAAMLQKRGEAPKRGRPEGPSGTSEQVRYKVLGQLSRQYRTKENLSIRALSKLTGISPATLSRMENGRPADTHNVTALSRILNISVERIAGPIVEDVPQMVKSILLADPKLTKDEAEALCATFSVLYRQIAGSK